MGLSIDEFKLKAGIFGAEPWTENMRCEIEKRLGITAYDIYGLSEIMGQAFRWIASINAAFIFGRIISFLK